MALKGLHTWTREISLAFKVDLTDAVRKDLAVSLPEDLPAAAKHPHARRAAVASDLVAIEAPLVDKLVSKGVRVHTIGCDRVTGGFYYFAKGGSGEAVRLQGNLVEMVAPALDPSSDNQALEATMDGLIGRILAELSDGLTEAQVELAAALPALGEGAPDAVVKLETLEGFLDLSSARATRYEERARTVVETVGQATRQGKEEVELPLFGHARRVVQPELEIEYAEGEAGARRKLTLPERGRWLVSGLPPESVAPIAVAPAAQNAKVDGAKADAERAAAEKAAAEKAAAERAAAEKKAEAAERARQEKAAAERSAKDRSAKADDERAAAAKVADEASRAEVTGKIRRVSAGVQPGKAGGSTPAWVWLILVVVALVGVYYFRYLRHHH